MKRPTLDTYKPRPDSAEYWCARWRDEEGRSRRHNLGKVCEVTKKHAEARLDDWIENEWRKKAYVRDPAGNAATYTVTNLADAYEEEAKQIYLKNGKTTSHVYQVVLAMEALRDHYGTRPADSMGAPEIAHIRDEMIWSEDQRGEKIALTRKTINGRLVIIKQAFAWARERGKVSQQTLGDVMIVKPLAFGRSKAKESRTVRPVSDAIVDTTIEQCTSVLKTMIEVQLFTGMRPGEVVAMKPCFIDRGEDVWVYRVPDEVYKLAHREDAPRREVYLGPKAQAKLAKFLLNRADDAYIFSPHESELERRRERFKDRKTPLHLGNISAAATTGNFRRARFKPGSGYTTASYRKAIEYACNRAEVDAWHPNQIRHTAGTAIRKKYGIEAASVSLGHSNLRTTEIYAEQNREKAMEIARKVG
jgi:integrase